MQCGRRCVRAVSALPSDPCRSCRLGHCVVYLLNTYHDQQPYNQVDCLLHKSDVMLQLLDQHWDCFLGYWWLWFTAW